MESNENISQIQRNARKLVYYLFDRPITWFHDVIIKPNQKVYPYYHRKYRRVPTIDQCYEDDYICHYEAQSQFRRDWKVEGEIINILRIRKEDCILYEGPDSAEKCQEVIKTYDDAVTNFFIKCIEYIFKFMVSYCILVDGELKVSQNVVDAYMKQKHRMLWERRHGPVGSGMKEKYKKLSDQD